MRTLPRPFLMVAAALLFGVVLSSHEVKAQTVGPHDVLISEFRLSGPGGDGDEFIEFYCNRDTDCDISGYNIQAFDPDSGDFLVSVPDSTVIPARQYLLLGNSSQFTLSDYAQIDLDVNDPDFPDFFIDNEGVQLISPDENTVIDSVGFTGGGNEGTYVEGTGLQPATDVRPADQYAYVRKRTLATNGLPQDTDDNANDFVLVSVTGAAHPGITAPPVLGAPGPQGLTSPLTYSNAEFAPSLVEPASASDTSPNRVRTGSGDSGTLSIRRSVTNNTDQSFDYISFRVIEIPTLNSPATIPNQAQLRLVTSPDAETFTNSQGRTVVIRGTVLEYDPDPEATPEPEPQQPNGGGLNSTVHANLNDSVIKPGETVDVQFLLNVVKAGNYRFFVYVEAFPVASAGGFSPATNRVVRSSATATSAPATTRHVVNVRRGGGFTLLKKLAKSKKFIAVQSKSGNSTKSAGVTAKSGGGSVIQTAPSAQSSPVVRTSPGLDDAEPVRLRVGPRNREP